MDLVELGSRTAKGGFANEDDIISKFNNWKEDQEAQHWLQIMKYDLDEIEYVNAIKIARQKADVQVQITITIKLKSLIEVENIQVKLVSNNSGFNQIDKRWIDSYIELWSIPDNITNILKRYTGELLPNISNPKDPRRMFANEFSKEEQKLILDWINDNKTLIVSDILRGRGRYCAEWMLVAQKVEENARWILKPMNVCIQYYSSGKIIITNRGNFKIGRITMQRKGGDGGRDTAKMLQFKIDPTELFDIDR